MQENKKYMQKKKYILKEKKKVSDVFTFAMLCISIDHHPLSFFFFSNTFIFYLNIFSALNLAYQFTAYNAILTSYIIYITSSWVKVIHIYTEKGKGVKK